MIGVDVGGTFTDVVEIREGKVLTHKVPTRADAYESVVEGAIGVGVEHAAVFNHASTHGLNAVVTRRVPKVGLLVTMGHRDAVDMGRIWRPSEAVMDPSW